MAVTDNQYLDRIQDAESKLRESGTGNQNSLEFDFVVHLPHNRALS